MSGKSVGSAVLVLGALWALGAAASASSIDVEFDRTSALPGETVQLRVSGVADSPADAVTVELAVTTPGSFPLPAPGPTWDDGATWGPPWDANAFAGIVRPDEPPERTNILGCDAFGLAGTFLSGDIVAIDMQIPDDGSYGFLDVLDVSVDFGQFALAGETSDVPPEGLGSAELVILLDPAPGDANRDGVVDYQDYLIVKSNLGQQSGMQWEDGDFDEDSDVDRDDRIILEGTFGFRASDYKAAMGGGMGAVPEPATLALIVLVGPLLLRRRRP